MKNRWIIADPHFGHANIIKYCNRPFSSVEEMNEILIQNWNETVLPGDRVYANGDFCINRKFINILEILNGKKVLIKGNHDNFKMSEYKPYFDDIRACMVEEDIVISHIPIFKGQVIGDIEMFQTEQ